MKLITAPDKAALGLQAAHDGAGRIRAAIARAGRASIILATGASQFEMLAALLREPIAWERVTAFHLDEYVGLPIAHRASFRNYLWERFHRRLPVPLAAFHYLDGEAPDPQAECDRVGGILRGHPIDVAFIGIGENAHLAFNDPPADFQTDAAYAVVALDADCRLQQVGEGWFGALEEAPSRAISMTCRQILKSAALLASVPDRRKAVAVRAVVRGPVTPAVPASVLQEHPDATLYLDPESASLL